MIYLQMSMSEANVPLAPATLLILIALSSGDKHGYAIMREARELSDGGFQIGPATLYTTIQRLLESGWIEEAPSQKTSDSRRRYYALTRSGNSVLNAELDRMAALMRKSKAFRLRSKEVPS